MSAHQSNSAYRQASVSGATHAGLLTVVYDALAADLREAGRAVHGEDIQLRCTKSNHAILLLGHLDTWADCLDDTALTASLKQFYAFLRLQILKLQNGGTREDYEKLSSLVLQVRSTWQEKSVQASRSAGVATVQPTPTQSTTPQASTRSLWCA